MAINANSEVSLVYWADLDLGLGERFRAALAGSDITHNGILYPANDTFLSIGTSTYEISTANQPIEINIIPTPTQMQLITNRSFFRRQARVWRANRGDDGSLNDIQQIKNGFLDSYGDAGGSAIIVTISSWMSIGQLSETPPNSLATPSQQIRNLNIAASRATQAPDLTDIQTAVNTNTIGVGMGECMPMVYVPRANTEEAEDAIANGTAFPADSNSQQPGYVQFLDNRFRSSIDNIYSIFADDRRNTFLTASDEELSNLTGVNPVFEDSLEYPFQQTTLGSVIRAELQPFDGTLQVGDGVAANASDIRQMRIPNAVGNRVPNYDTTRAAAGSGATWPSLVDATNVNNCLPPEHLVNPDGFMQDSTWTLLMRQAYSDDLRVIDEPRGIDLSAVTATGRQGIANYAYDRLVEDRTRFSSLPSGQVLKFDQALSLGPVNRVTISAPIFSNTYNRFSANDTATLSADFSEFPDRLIIDLDAGTVQTRADGTTTALTRNADNSLTGSIYAAVFNNYYAPVGIMPIRAHPDGIFDGAAPNITTARPVLPAWLSIQGYNNRAWNPSGGNTQTTAQTGGGFYPSDLSFHVNGSKYTRHNKVMEFTIYPGDPDGGRVCWISWTIYNRALEASVISARSQVDPVVTNINGRFNRPDQNNILTTGSNQLINIIDEDERAGNGELFRFVYQISSETSPQQVLQDILTNQIGLDDNLINTESFRTPAALNTDNFANLAGDLSRFSGTLTEASTSLFPTELHGSSPADSFTEIIDEVYSNSGLVAIEDKSEGSDETPIYMFAGIARDTDGTRNGFAGVFTEANATFGVDFARSTQIPNAFISNPQILRTTSGTGEIQVVGSELSLTNENYRAIDNGFINTLRSDFSLQEFEATFNAETGAITFDDTQLDIPANRAAYDILVRRIGFDRILVNTDYNTAGSIRLGDYVQIQWAKFGWVGNNSISALVSRIEDDNQGRITLECQRHDNIINAGWRANSFTRAFSINPSV